MATLRRCFLYRMAFPYVTWISFVYAPSCTTIGALPVSVDSQQLGYGTEPYIVYLFGGSATSVGINSNDIYKWNVSSNTYVKLSTKTPTNQFHSFTNNALQINNVLYFVGMQYTQFVHLFDVTTEQWINNTNISPLPTHATHGCVTGNETHLFFIGGITPDYYRLDIVQIYDIVANKWNSHHIDITPIKNTGWSGGYCQFVDGTMYIFGGEIMDIYYDGDPSNIVSDIFTLEANMQWSNIGNLPMPLMYGIALRYYHFIYIIGGQDDEFVSMNVIYEFDTKLHQITKQHVGIMIKPLHLVSAAIINDNLYIFGGYSWIDDSPINDVQLCDILNNNVSSTTDLPTTVPLSYTNVPTSNPNAGRTTTINATLAPLFTTTNTEIITLNTSKGAMLNTTNELSTLHPTNITTNHGSTQQQLVINATNNTINMIANTTNDKILTSELKILSTISYKQDYVTSNILRPRMKTDDASKYIVLGIIGVFLGVLVGVIALCSYMYLERRKEQKQQKEDVSHIRFAADDDVKINELEPQPMFIQQDIQLTEEGLGGFYEAKCVICNQMRLGNAGQVMAFYCIECKKEHDPNILQDDTKGYLSRNIPSKVIADQVTASAADTIKDNV